MIEVIPYEERLNADRRRALLEGSMHFEKASSVFRTLETITRRLRELDIAYAVAGAMAMFVYGYRRFTEDVNLLVTRSGLERIYNDLLGCGYIRPSPAKKHILDTETGVRIEFLVAHDSLVRGAPNTAVFPSPDSASIEIEGMRFLTLESLIELKLASGITNPLRKKDIADIQELIGILKLGEEFTFKLHPFVWDKFLELVRLIRDNPQPPE